MPSPLVGDGTGEMDGTGVAIGVEGGGEVLGVVGTGTLPDPGFVGEADGRSGELGDGAGDRPAAGAVVTGRDVPLLDCSPCAELGKDGLETTAGWEVVAACLLGDGVDVLGCMGDSAADGAGRLGLLDRLGNCWAIEGGVGDAAISTRSMGMAALDTRPGNR